MTPSPLWFVDRSSGEITLLLMSAVVILGILRSGAPAFYPVLVSGLHTNLALAAIAFGGLHIVTAVLDPFGHLGVVDALVPFASAYRDTWLGLGVVSGYLYTAIALSSWPVRRLPRVAWRWLHRAIYVAWALALVHSLGTGSDTTNATFAVLDWVGVAGVLVAFVGVRVVEAWPKSPPLWASLAAIAMLVVLGIAVWAETGPMRPGWAQSSGTPSGLLRTR